MANQYCSPEQEAALEKIVQGIEQVCPDCHFQGERVREYQLCERCGGSDTGKVHPYAGVDALGAWLSAHGKERLYADCHACDDLVWSEVCKVCGGGGIENNDGYVPVFLVSDALELLKEVGWHITLILHEPYTPGDIWAEKDGVEQLAETAAELLALVLAEIEKEAKHERV